jgi:nitrite reductase/ring-hydroxylating ferredoxin subunit
MGQSKTSKQVVPGNSADDNAPNYGTLGVNGNIKGSRVWGSTYECPHCKLHGEIRGEIDGKPTKTVKCSCCNGEFDLM